MAREFEKFNPYKEAKFKQSYTGDNQEYNLTKNGCPIAVMGEDGIARLLMGPAVFFKKSTMLNWFKSEYPDGVVDEELISYESARVILKVSLYKNHTRTDYIASAHGVAMEKNYFYDIFREMNAEGTENSTDLYNLAFYLGLKQALERAGLSINYDPEFLMEHVPGYKQACHTGEKANIGDEIIIQHDGFDGPNEQILKKEEKIKKLYEEIEQKAPAEMQEMAEENEIRPKAEQILAQAPVQDELEELDPIQEFLKSTGQNTAPDDGECIEEAAVVHAEDAEPKAADTVQETETPKEMTEAEIKKEPENGFGDEILEVGPTAGMKLKAYAGEKLKNIPRDILEFIASKDDWNGKISDEMLEKVKDYLF